ncbi:MAG: HAD family hydrolase [Gammaproteobacteria bacterium]|nr:MAG: HAD family hydrolase [Gammaproteobacteria bacterium]UTW41801.1 HAD family hydrolase [bacterium SCSIO 12844]
MNKPYELLIFDWDGTLVNSRAKIFNAVRHGCKIHNYPDPSDEQLANQVGLALEKSFQNLYPDETNLPIQSMIDGYEEYFYNNPNESQLFEGTYEILKQLETSDYLLAIATGKRREPLEHDLKNFGIDHFFTITRTPNESPSKPNPQMLFDILDYTGLNPNQAIMIGDSIFDLQAAENANMDAIAVSYGIKSIDVLKDYHHSYVLDKITDLPKLLHSINN